MESHVKSYKCCCCRTTRKTKFSIYAVIGLLIAILGSLAIAFWPAFFDDFLFRSIRIRQDSMSYPIWKDVPLPLYMDFSFYNWENPHEIKNLSTKPIFREMGPYVFKEEREKVIQEWHPENDTISFYQNRTWVFEPSLSNGTLDDKVTTLNIVAITAAYVLRHSPEYLKGLLNIVFNVLNIQPHITYTVREYLFDGYQDTVLDLGNLLPPGILPLNLPFKKFGWVVDRNGSAAYDGLFNMFTGVDDISHLAELHSWNRVSQGHYYPSYCGQINGSAGEMFPPKRDKTTIAVFSTDFCRTLTLPYKEEVKVDGIPGFRFWGNKGLFGNPKTNPDNACFCDEQNNECYPDGVVNVSTCKWGAPAFISFPHFFNADPSYLSAIVGMKPDEDLHQLFIDLEPNSGFPIQVNVSFQINLLLQPIKEYKLFRDMPTIFFPSIWLKQRLLLAEDLAPKLKLFLIFDKVGEITGFLLLSVGIIALILVSMIWLRK